MCIPYVHWQTWKLYKVQLIFEHNQHAVGKVQRTEKKNTLPTDVWERVDEGKEIDLF